MRRWAWSRRRRDRTELDPGQGADLPGSAQLGVISTILVDAGLMTVRAGRPAFSSEGLRGATDLAWGKSPRAGLLLPVAEISGDHPIRRSRI